MDKRIKSAFNEIKAEQELKTSTKYYLYEKRNSSTKPHINLKKKAFAFTAACMVILISSSFFIYSLPVNAISLDGNDSSVELGINTFNKVVKVTCFGNEEEISCLGLRNMNYKDAVATILENTAEYQSSTLTVSCKNIEKGNKIAEEMRRQQCSDTEVHCHGENRSISAEAHSHGISTGKYQAYLTLKEYEPELTVEEAKNLTMKELRNRISLHCSDIPAEEETTSEETTLCNNTHNNQTGNQHHGNYRH